MLENERKKKQKPKELIRRLRKSCQRDTSLALVPFVDTRIVGVQDGMEGPLNSSPWSPETGSFPPHSRALMPSWETLVGGMNDREGRDGGVKGGKKGGKEGMVCGA